jgi:hypothetical protein
MRRGESLRIIAKQPEVSRKEKAATVARAKRKSADWSASMKNGHRVSQAVSKLIRSRAAGRKILKRVRRIAANIAMLGPAASCRLGPSRGTARYPRSDNRAARSLVASFEVTYEL